MSYWLRDPKVLTQVTNTAPRRCVSGNPLSRIDAEGRKYTWAYDGLGRQSSETDFAGNTTSTLRDQAGNGYQSSNRLAQLSQATYDKLNRPTGIVYFDGTSETMAYDPAGNPSAVANATLNYSFSYDGLNRLLSKSGALHFRRICRWL